MDRLRKIKRAGYGLRLGLRFAALFLIRHAGGNAPAGRRPDARAATAGARQNQQKIRSISKTP